MHKAVRKSNQKRSCGKITQSVIVASEELQTRASLRDLKEELLKSLRHAEGTANRLRQHIASIEALLTTE